ncbi:MAG: MFS transporter, partial [Acidimicrobiales bacterium]
ASITRQPALVAGVLTAQRLPWLLLALPAGALIDRLDRGRIMRWADLLRGAVLLGLVAALLYHAVGIWLLYAFALLVGAGEPFFTGASIAVLPSIVEPEQLPRANGRLGALQTVGEQTAGPAVGGLLFAVSRAIPFLADAVSFVASAALLVGLGRRSRSPSRSHARRASVASDIAEGLRWFRANRAIRLLSAVIASMALCQSMVMGVLVLFGLERLHLSQADYGFFLAVGACGNVVGALVAERAVRRLGTAATILTGGLVAGVAYLAISTTSSAFVGAALFFVEGFGIICGNVASFSLRQSIIPGELLGRVGNVMRMIIWGVLPLGALLGGGLAATWTLGTPIAVAGAIQVVVVLVSVRPLSRAVRDAERPARGITVET